MASTVIGQKLRDLIAYHDITQDQLADDLHVSRITINQLCNGSRRLTANLALRLERYCGISAKTWLDLQAYMDLHTARQRHIKVLKLIKHLHRVTPP